MAKPTLIRRNTDQSAMQRALDGGAVAADTGPSTVALIPSQDDATTIYVVGQNYNVPLFVLQKSENNARVFYSAEELDEMSKSLKDEGQDIPAIGYVKNGRIILVDGQKRFQAATNAGLPTLKVLIAPTPASESEEYEESRRINLHRSAQTALDDAVRWKSMLAKGIYKDPEDLSDRLGLTKGTVSKVLGLNRIPDRLLRMMSDHPQTRALTIAYEISVIFNAAKFTTAPEQAEYLAQEVIEETAKRELNREQVQFLIRSKIEGPKTRTRGESHVVKYGETRGTLKVFPARGQLDLTFRNLAHEKVEELRERIEQMLAGQLSI